MRFVLTDFVWNVGLCQLNAVYIVDRSSCRVHLTLRTVLCMWLLGFGQRHSILGIKLLVLSQRERICWVWIEMKKAWGRSNLLFLSTRRSNWEEENRLFRREWQGIRGGQTSVRGQLNLGCSRDKKEIEKPLVFKKIGEDSEKEKIHGFKWNGEQFGK